VNDAKDVVSQLLGPSAKVIAYAPTNTMIITDAGYNIRRAYRIVKQLDVAAPKSTLTFIHLNYATASDVQKILEQIYPSAASSTSGTSSSSSGGGQSAADRAAARRRRREGADDTAPAAGGSASTVGAEGAYVSKFISDDRTNSIIVMANDEALQKIRELIAQIDVDIDPNSRSQIHVVYLEHANASDVASVLQSLSQSGSGGSSRSSTGTSRSGTNRGGQQGGTNRSGGGGFQGGGGFPGGGGGGGFKGGPPGLPGGAGGTEGTSSSGGTAAAFDSGVRITADDNTNSLVLIAAPEDFRILKGVIDRLDIPRRQVFVEAAVVEVASDDSNTFGIGYHGGKLGDDNSLEYLSGQLGGASASLPFTVGTTGATLLSGLAAGVIGKSLEIPYTDPSTGTSTTISVPAFGIALNALASNSAVNILSDPSLLVVDNEQATITVGRTVPFPVSAGSSALTGNPVVSFQREDVGITLEVTPQINEANYVTLDVSLEVAEIEGDVTSSDPSSGGPITSKRQTENVVVVKDNQTIVIGGLISTTQTKTATKIPVLGDIPLLGVLFRGKGDTERKSNLLIFLTPHVINEPADLEEVYRVKWAQREEFLRRFYGKSRDKQEAELEQLLGGSMNFIDKPSPYRTKQPPVPSEDTIDIHPTTPTTPAAPAQAAPTTAPDAGGDDDEATPAPDGAGN
jgi:general secretion pathway protein D